MEREAKGGPVSLLVEPISAPALHLASEEAGKASLGNKAEIKKRLVCQMEAEVSPVEKWGVLVKWWRIVELALFLTGLFSHWRNMRKGKKNLKVRYNELVDKHVREDKAEAILSFKQAEKYDRLGKFLHEFPKFIFQLQFVSLGDWVHGEVCSKVLVGRLKAHLGGVDNEEEKRFWQENVVAAVAVAEGGGVEQPPAVVVVEGENREPGAMVEQMVDDGSGSAGDEVEEDDAGEATPEEEGDRVEECPKCGIKAQTVFLECDGPDKKHTFCWKCEGYSGPPALELRFPDGVENSNTTIKTYVFCAEHLKLECCTRPYGLYKRTKTKGRRLLKIGDFVNHVQAEEARQLVAIFTSPERKFSVVAVDPDGWCIFGAAAKGLDMDWRVLVKEMKVFAREYFKSDDNAALFGDAQEARQLWNQLDPRRKTTVQAFWSSDAADLLIPMLAQHLNTLDVRTVQFRVWMIGEKGELEMTKLMYPEGETGEFKKVVDLLKTNQIVEHYELLKENGLPQVPE